MSATTRAASPRDSPVEVATLLISSASTSLSCGSLTPNAKFLPESGQRIDVRSRSSAVTLARHTFCMSSPAFRAADEAGLRYRVITHGQVRSLAEAALARGVAPADVVKTLVVRRADGDFL